MVIYELEFGSRNSRLIVTCCEVRFLNCSAIIENGAFVNSAQYLKDGETTYS